MKEYWAETPLNKDWSWVWIHEIEDGVRKRYMKWGHEVEDPENEREWLAVTPGFRSNWETYIIEEDGRNFEKIDERGMVKYLV